MKNLTFYSLLAICLFSAATAFSQSDKGSFYLSGTSGIIMPLQKSNMEFADKMIFGFEGNYFVSKGISVTGGLDYLLGGNQTMAVFGTRLYPGAGTFYVRHKAMVNVKSRYSNDFMLGVGNDFPLSDKLAAELNVDYHFTYQAIGVKFGLALTL